MSKKSNNSQRNIFYNNDKKLRKAEIKIEMAPEQIREVVKCRNDIEYFLKTYVKIVSLDEGLVDFKLYDYQLRLMKVMQDENRVINLSPRQSGKSISTCGFLLHYILFHNWKNIAILANKEKTARKILAKIKLMYRNLPIWLQRGVEEWNKNSIKLDNGCYVEASATSSSGIRGDSCAILYIDETAFIDKNLWDEFYSSSYPTISSSKKSKIILSSCVTKETMIFSNDGIQEISNFIPNNKKGFSNIDQYNILGKSTQPNVGVLFYNNGKVDTKIIKTRYSELECSYNHKLWACKDGVYDWFKAEDLSDNDYISLKYNMQQFINDDDISDIKYFYNNKMTYKYDFGKIITQDLAHFFGYFLADGYAEDTTNKRVVLSSEDDVGFIFNKIGVKYTNSEKDKIHFVASSKIFINFLKDIGFDLSKKAKEKCIPQRLMKMGKSNIIALLSGLFDGDGCSRIDRGNVSIGLTSKKMIKQIQMLLINLGYVPVLDSQIVKPTKKVKVFSKLYRLTLNKHDSLKFYEEIGFRISRKQNKKISLNLKKCKRDSYDIIPFSKPILKKIKSNYRKSKGVNNVVKFIGIGRKKQKHFSRQIVLNWKKELENYNDVELEKFFGNVDDNIKWVQIKSIKDSQNETYDFSLPNIEGDKWCHSVLYNGIIGHQTPRGMNHFYKMWTDAKNKRTDFIPFQVYWQEVPYMDEEYKKKIIAEFGEEKWLQEYECEFLGSAGTLIGGRTLKTLVHFDPIELKQDEKFLIYEYPKEDHKYVAICDVSEGLGLDSSTIQVIDVTNIPYKQVAKFENNEIKTYEYPDTIYIVAKYYNEALVIVESNSIGDGVLNDLNYDLDCENLFFFDDKFGIKMTKGSKRIGNSFLKQYIEDGTLQINDFDTISQMSKYIKKGTSYQAEEDEHDDLITPLVLFSFFMRNKIWVEDWLDQDASERQENIDRLEEELLPIGFINDGDEILNMGEDNDGFISY